jgi:CRISPR-associated protein Csm4
MPLHRIRLALEGPLGTPLTSGTIFGHLCWAVLRRDGETALVAWLRALREGVARFLLSDAFPADLLPRPLLPPHRQPEASLTQQAEAKTRAKYGWIKQAAFLQHRRAMSPARLHDLLADWRPSSAVHPHDRIDRCVHAHNVIDRLTGTTPETAGLWFVEDDWSFAAAPERDLYVDTDLPSAEVEALLSEVGQHGYGRDATYGRGCFRVLEARPDTELLAHAGNRMMSLSHGCLTEAMKEPRYERFTHFGKVGIELAMTGARPFKRPVLLIKPGATFRPEGPGPFGALLGGPDEPPERRIHQDRAEVVHHAWHLAIPYTEVAA